MKFKLLVATSFSIPALVMAQAPVKAPPSNTANKAIVPGAAQVPVSLKSSAPSNKAMAIQSQAAGIAATAKPVAIEEVQGRVDDLPLAIEVIQ